MGATSSDQILPMKKLSGLVSSVSVSKDSNGSILLIKN
jgi:hypothetical protein